MTQMVILYVIQQLLLAFLNDKLFVTVSHDITRVIPRPSKSPLHFMVVRISNSFYIAPSVPSDISDIISLLKLGKYLRPNSIPMKIL